MRLVPVNEGRKTGSFYAVTRRSEVSYDAIVREAIEEQGVSPIDMLGLGDANGEYTYLNSQRASYIRTVNDVDSLNNRNGENVHVLEIGSFLGVVSISLKKLGYRVSACDIPEFHESQSLRNLYQEHGIPFDGVNLRHARLPYESGSFDLVVACEVVEHLNFNPLPVLGEINRVLKENGLLYIAMPNQVRFVNRMKLFFGQSIHNRIEDFSKQLDRQDNMIVGLHWREYALSETVQMVEAMGFEIVRQSLFTGEGDMGARLLKRGLRKLLYSYPPFRPSQVVIGRKVAVPIFNFWLTEANS